MASFTIRNGRVRARVRIGSVSKSETFATRDLARKWAASIESQAGQIRATGVISSGKATIADLIDTYIQAEETRKAWGRSKTADLARLRKDLGDLRASAITKKDIVDYFRRRADEGAGPVTVSAAIGYLIKVFKYARDLESLDVPVEVITAARDTLRANDLSGKSDQRVRGVHEGRVTDGEIAQLCTYFNGRKDTTDYPMSDITRFAVASCMRIGEVCRITWSDFNERAATIVIRDRKDPRAKAGNDQTVPLLPDAIRIIKRQPHVDGEERVFPYSEKTASTYFTRAVKACGIRDLHLHDLRHEGISRLFDSGMQIPDVAKISGHKSWEMLRRYSKVTASGVHQRHRARKKAERVAA